MSEIQRSFSLNIKILSSTIFCRHSGCVHSDVHSLNTTIVEGPIERHKSRRVSRETCDGLNGTYSGGSLDRTDTVPKWSREGRARAGLRGASRRNKALCSWSLDHSLCPEMSLMFYNHIDAQMLIKFFRQGDTRRVICNSNPLRVTKASCTIPVT